MNKKDYRMKLRKGHDQATSQLNVATLKQKHYSAKLKDVRSNFANKKNKLITNVRKDGY